MELPPPVAPSRKTLREHRQPYRSTARFVRSSTSRCAPADMSRHADRQHAPIVSLRAASPHRGRRSSWQHRVTGAQCLPFEGEHQSGRPLRRCAGGGELRGAADRDGQHCSWPPRSVVAAWLRTDRHVLVNVKHLGERLPYMRPTFSGRTQRSGTRRRVDCTVHGEPCAPEHNDRHAMGNQMPVDDSHAMAIR